MDSISHNKFLSIMEDIDIYLSNYYDIKELLKSFREMPIYNILTPIGYQDKYFIDVALILDIRLKIEGLSNIVDTMFKVLEAEASKNKSIKEQFKLKKDNIVHRFYLAYRYYSTYQDIPEVSKEINIPGRE